jgi:hypothetical protein
MVNNGQSSMLALTAAFGVNLFMLTFFVCLLKDIAETLLFCDLVDNCLDNKQQLDFDQMVTPVAKKLFPEGYEVIRTSDK